MTDPRLPALLTPEEIAEWLGITPRAVMDLARAYAGGDPKGLPGVKVLNHWRFTAAHAEQYIAANTTTPEQVARPMLVQGSGTGLSAASRRRLLSASR